MKSCTIKNNSNLVFRKTIRSTRIIRGNRNRSLPIVHIRKSYSELLNEINNGEVEFAKIAQNERFVTITKLDGTIEEITLPAKNTIVDTFIEHNVPISIEPVQQNFNPLEIGAFALQILIFGLVIRAIFFSNRGGQNNNMFSFGESKATEVESDKINVTFKDVAGIENAKRDLKEIVDFLKKPEKYTRVGAKIPKGVLLVGPPGTGKTLLARAVAGEADVPFFSSSGSDFIEMFVGVGASRIRDLFKKAEKKAPCIIFIDEIDAIGKSRSSNMGPGQNDERDQTINQLLTAMDGFTQNSGIIVIAATNRPELLDSALLRPGRFDRKVTVDLPDYNGRTQILKVHTQNKPLESDVELEYIAKNTVGFSGADLENLANETAILAARDNREIITKHDWEMALEKVMIGDERPTMLLSETKRKVLAYHEAGHALMSLLLSDFDRLRKVSIIPRGSAGGVTYFEPNEERIDMNLVTRDYLENQIMVSLAGRIAEELIFGTMNATTGAYGDFQNVSEIAYNMVASYGFSETMGPMSWDTGNVDVNHDVSAEMKFIVDYCYRKAKLMIENSEFYLHRIAEALLEKETLNDEDIKQLTVGLKLDIKIKEELDTVAVTYDEE